jgi:hypothetical protein
MASDDLHRTILSRGGAAVTRSMRGRLAASGAPARLPLRMRARLLSALLLVACTGCLWRSYSEVMRVHLDVLGGLADKAAFNAEHGARPTSNDVTELTYPLERARQFAYQYRSYAERESYRRFVTALDRYQALVETVDAARGDEARWAAERLKVVELNAAWRDAAQHAGDALDRER